VLLQARPARLIAFAHTLVRESWSGPAWRVEEHELRRWCRLLDESGIDADPAALDLDLPSRPTPAEAIDATILHPGAASLARRWPPERWAAVAAAERAMGRTVLLTGTMAERALAFAVARDAGLPPDVLALAALVRRAGRVVCGDTGIAHLATALRTPSVVLFGPRSPSLWGPPAERPWHRALWCGTRGDPHATRPDDGLLRIGVGEVIAALPNATPRREDEVRRRRRTATASPSLPRTLRRVGPGR